MIYLDTHKWVEKKLLQDLPVYRRQYTVFSTFEDRHKIRAYRETDERFGFPIYHKYPIPELNGEKVTDRRSTGSPTIFSIKTPLRGEQVSIVMQFRQALASGKTGIILDARTGAGKTLMGTACISMIGATTIVVVPKSDLVHQWKTQLLRHTDLRPEDVGIVQRDQFEVTGKKIVISMLQTLLRRKYSEEFYRNFGVLFVDELHTLGCPHFSKLMNLFPTKYRLGASATVKRRDGTTDVFLQSMGECVIRSQIRHEESLSVKVRAVLYQDKGKLFRMPKWATTMMQRRSTLLTHLGRDPRRCSVLAYYAQKLARGGRQVAILAERMEQLRNIEYYLKNKYEVDSSWIGDYIGETKKKERERVIQECRILLATTKMLSLGTDIPSLSCLILASPLASIRQPVGRTLRRSPGKTSVIVIDLVDQQYRMARGWFNQRQKEYKLLHAEVLTKEG